MVKLITTLFSAMIEEMYKLFRLGRDTDTLAKTTIKKSVFALTIIMVIVTFMAMGQRLIDLNREVKHQREVIKDLTHQSKNQPNAPSDSAPESVNSYSLSHNHSVCLDDYCRQHRNTPSIDGFHGIKIRTKNE